MVDNGAMDLYVALTKCTETASSSQPVLHAAGQGEREQSLNPAFHTSSPPFTSLEWPVPTGVTQSRRTCRWSCQRAVLAACALGAPRVAPPLVLVLGSPQAQRLLGQLFLSRDFPPDRGSSAWTPVQDALEVMFRVCVSVSASWL